MKHFAHRIVIILLHHIWEHRAAWHLTHRQVMHFGKYLVNSQDEGCRESIIFIYLLVLHSKFFFYFSNSRNDTFNLFRIEFFQFIFRYGNRLTA